MKHLLAIIVVAVTAAGCYGQSSTGGPPPITVLGDSVGWEVGSQLPNAINDAVGGTTACDTAEKLPPAQRVLLHVGGHSWGLYDAQQWQACVMQIVNHYGAAKVWLALTDLPGAIYCADGNYANQQLDAAHISHADLTVNPTYELETRLEEANAWKQTVPGVHVVDWRGDEHNGPPDCIHLDQAGINQAVAQTEATL